MRMEEAVESAKRRSIFVDAAGIIILSSFIVFIVFQIGSCTNVENRVSKCQSDCNAKVLACEEELVKIKDACIDGILGGAEDE
jgi:hypothetical protein